MFEEIADIPRYNLRVLSDLFVQCCSCKNTLRFKLDTGASVNMLPYDVWKQLFPGRSNADLLCTVDKSVTLQVYNKNEMA